MNLVQSICCLLLAKGSEVSHTYLSSKSEGLQSMLRARRLTTAEDAQRFLDSAITELTLSGGDFCKCDSATSVDPITPEGGRQLGGNSATWYKSWKQRKN